MLEVAGGQAEQFSQKPREMEDPVERLARREGRRPSTRPGSFYHTRGVSGKSPSNSDMGNKAVILRAAESRGSSEQRTGGLRELFGDWRGGRDVAHRKYKTAFAPAFPSLTTVQGRRPDRQRDLGEGTSTSHSLTRTGLGYGVPLQGSDG